MLHEDQVEQREWEAAAPVTYEHKWDLKKYAGGAFVGCQLECKTGEVLTQPACKFE